jgi:hypothetical protein
MASNQPSNLSVDRAKPLPVNEKTPGAVPVPVFALADVGGAAAAGVELGPVDGAATIALIALIGYANYEAHQSLTADYDATNQACQALQP